MKTQKTIASVKPSAAFGNKLGVSFPIIGIGASAGGLEAFELFFRHMPVDNGMAFVLVPHLDPGHASLLTEILQRATRMPVVEAVDRIPVEPNHVYIIPPNREMEIFHGKLQLSLPTLPHGQRLPIDAFLRSLADDQQDKAIGIVLSGAGTDGTLGLRAIQGGGGITLAQDPGQSKYDGMPGSAIHAGYASIVLPVEKMPEALLAGVRHFVVPGDSVESKAASGMGRILLQLRNKTGHDFSLYKKTTIVRRIERRMLLHAIDDIEVYARYLKENPFEVRVLFKELLINVTSFFRDAEAFVELEKHILPKLLKDKADDYVFRVWVAGCATGEEAYSIAMLLCEWMDERRREFKVLIYSTDLDDEAIGVARAGIYPANIFQDVSAERLSRFFIKEDSGFRIKKRVREMVVFAVQNIIQDPPFTRLDLLCCRNLMIYLESELQDRLIPVFHYALKPGGVLFISPSESIGNHVDLFAPLNRKWKFYRAIHSTTSTRALMAGPLNWAAQSNGKISEEVMASIKEINFAELTRRVLTQIFAPASVITDLKGDILYVHGETGKYLRPAPGKASLNVVEMAREGLSQALRVAIHAVGANETLVLNQEASVVSEAGFMPILLSVRSIPDSEGGQRLLVVSFQDVDAPAEKPVKRKRSAKSADLGRIEELERDLVYVKQNHQASIKEQQASNEELKSANEELQSTNEELQSSNEELEISKEELQSVNEELITVNSELQVKIEQLAGMQNDMKNLLDNVYIGIIFLDKHLVIRRFTREATRVYRLVASDVGRPLSDIKPVVAGDDLLIEAKAVLESLVPYEREMCIDNDIWMLARIQAYRTVDNVIDGVVLTFTDITTRIKSFVAQQALILAESIVNTIREPFIVLDHALNVVSASQSFYRDFYLKPDETLGRLIYELGGGQWDEPALHQLLQSVLSGDQAFEGYELAHDFSGMGQRKILLNARRVVGRVGEPPLILLSMEVNP